MKKLIILSSLLCISIACKAQTIPVEGVDDYKKTNNSGIPDGAYIKDVNGLFNKYIGTWKTTYNNYIYIIIITKKTTTFLEVKKDELHIKYLITKLDGTVVEDTRNETRNSTFGKKFSDDKMSYILGFSGNNHKCGNRGNMYLSYVSATTIKLVLNYRTGVVTSKDCIESYDVTQEPIYPLSTTPFTLTKQ